HVRVGPDAGAASAVPTLEARGPADPETVAVPGDRGHRVVAGRGDGAGSAVLDDNDASVAETDGEAAGPERDRRDVGVDKESRRGRGAELPDEEPGVRGGVDRARVGREVDDRPAPQAHDLAPPALDDREGTVGASDDDAAAGRGDRRGRGGAEALAPTDD